MRPARAPGAGLPVRALPVSQGHARLAALLSDAQAAKLADVLEPHVRTGYPDGDSTTLGVVVEVRRGRIVGCAASVLRRTWLWTVGA